MTFVLGLSVTSAGARAVLVEGAAGDGATIDQFTSATAEGLVGALLEDPTFGAALADTVSAIGVTCSHEAGAAAGVVVDELWAGGYPNVVAVPELDAAEALSIGLADLAGHTDVAVCLVEPDDALMVVVGADGAALDGMAPAAAEEVAARLIATLDPAAPAPEAIFVLGSAADVDDVVAVLEGAIDVPVISAQDGHLALARGAALVAARGAALVSARAVDTSQPSIRPEKSTSVRALSSVLVAATLTFVVSLSVALGLRLTPQSAPEQRAAAHTTREARQVVDRPSAPRGVPSAPAMAEAAEAAPEILPPEEVAQVPAPVREVTSIQPWQAPAPAAPAPAPPAAPPAPPPVDIPPQAPVHTPPDPAYVPPAPPPEYVPPANPIPQLRIRDRIIERLPIIDRFHLPEFLG